MVRGLVEMHQPGRHQQHALRPAQCQMAEPGKEVHKREPLGKEVRGLRNNNAPKECS